MSKIIPPISNRLLLQIPTKEASQLRVQLTQVELRTRQIIYDAGKTIEYAYFVDIGALSMVHTMENGATIEVGTIGYEGMAGLPSLLGVSFSPYKIFVQVPGCAMRISIGALKREFNRDLGLRHILLRYCFAFESQMAQSVACNGLHNIRQRCCRWILMTQDRSKSDEIKLTHEFLAFMLGVRRASVSEVLLPLQKKGLIRYHRGSITVVDRIGLESESCECYRTAEDIFNRILGNPKPLIGLTLP